MRAVRPYQARGRRRASAFACLLMLLAVGTADAIAGDLPASAPAQAQPGQSPAARSAPAVTIMKAPGLASVRISRTGDAEGQPVDIARPRILFASPAARKAQVAAGITSVPARMRVTAGSISSSFGLRTHPIFGGLRLHAGVDLAAMTGTPVVATSDGMVRRADWMAGLGLAVIIDHANRLQTRYGHMSRLNVASGQQVRAGQVIGYVGTTGNSTGPHLHYEVRVDGRATDPAHRSLRN